MAGCPGGKLQWGMGRIFLYGLQLIMAVWYFMQVKDADVLQELAAVDWTVLLAALSSGIAAILLRSYRRQVILRPIQKYSVLDLTAEALRSLRQKMHLMRRCRAQNSPSGLLRKSGVPAHVSRTFLAVDRFFDLLAAAVVLLLCLIFWNVPAGMFALAGVCATAAMLVLVVLCRPGLTRVGRGWNIAQDAKQKSSLFRSRLRMVTKPIGRRRMDYLLVCGLTLLALGADYMALVNAAGAVHLSLDFLHAALLFGFLIILWQVSVFPGELVLFDTLVILFMWLSGWESVQTALPVLLGHCAFILTVEWAAAAATAAEGMQEFQKPVLLRIRMIAVMIPSCAVPDLPKAVDEKGFSADQPAVSAVWESRNRDGLRTVLERESTKTPVSG